MSSAAMTLEEVIEKVVGEHAGKVGALMPVLHGVQHLMGHIPADAIPIIARLIGLSRAEVHGVMHFYHDFRAEPAGDHVVQICRAEACQAMGGQALESHARRALGVDFGETTPDGRFTLEAVYCLGNCACTPSIRIDDDIHARVTPSRFDGLLSKLAENAE